MYGSHSKHLSYSPQNHLMIAQRDISPKNINKKYSNHGNALINAKNHPNKNHKGSGTKTYTTEDVTKMIKSYIEPKLYYLNNELQSKQQIISELNQKLDQNDHKMQALQNHVDSFSKKQKFMSELAPNGAGEQHQLKTVMRNLQYSLKEMYTQQWRQFSEQIHKLHKATQQKLSQDQKIYQTYESVLEDQICELKQSIHQYIEHSRTRNNNYWLKIKEALNRLNSKITKVDESIVKAHSDLEAWKERNSEFMNDMPQVVSHLKDGKQVVKKLIELKISVRNIYESYQEVMGLQGQYRSRVEKAGQKAQLQESSDLLGLNEDDGNDRRGRLSPNQAQSALERSEDANFLNKAGQTFPLMNYRPNRQDSINENEQTHEIVLEYSREEQLGNPSEEQGLFEEQNDLITPKNQNSHRNSPTESPAAKYFIPQTSTLYSKVSASPLSASSASQYHKKHRILQKKPQYQEHNPLVLQISTPEAQHLQSRSPNESSDAGLSCLNSTSNHQHYLGYRGKKQSNGNSSSFLQSSNVLLESQQKSVGLTNGKSTLSTNNNEMSLLILKQRVNELIEVKSLQRPIKVFLDEINYLKNQEGNYLFDLKGNMFKIKARAEKEQLEEEGLLQFVEAGGQKLAKKS